METGALNWPEERVGGTEDAARFAHAGSNLCLDLHGDPTRASLVVFSDGNHHMALEGALRAFARRHPDVEEVFYATTPPRVIADWLRVGRVQLGNLRLTLKPHVFISPPAVLDQLAGEGLVRPHTPFMRSRGCVFVVPRGNPKGIVGVRDLLRDDVRLFLSNPVTEAVSHQAYADCLRRLAAGAGVTLAFLDPAPGRHDPAKLCYGELIHHREAPQAIADGRADVALVYHHLGLRYQRVFPEVMAFVHPEGMDEQTCPPSRYHLSLVGDGGRWGASLLEFLASDQVTDIYQAHGLAR